MRVSNTPDTRTLKMLIDYEAYLSRLPLSTHTRRNYLGRVRRFLAWLQECPEGFAVLDNDAERAFAVQEFKLFLLHKDSSANTVNSTLAALDNFFLYKGLSSAKVKRQDLPKQAPRALDSEEQKRFLRAVLSCKSLRNRVIAMVMIHCGLRISEVSELNLSDVVLTARKRELTVRCGKNSKRRTVPINKEAADVLQDYLAIRRNSERNAPLFVSQQNVRLSVQSIDHAIRQLGKQAHVELSSHSLRHTFVTRLIRSGIDVVIAAELAGHSRLETTRRYSLPTADAMISAVERLNYAASP